MGLGQAGGSQTGRERSRATEVAGEEDRARAWDLNLIQNSAEPSGDLQHRSSDLFIYQIFKCSARTDTLV